MTQSQGIGVGEGWEVVGHQLGRVEYQHIVYHVIVMYQDSLQCLALKLKAQQFLFIILRDSFMGKYYKTYTRNKKESNISQPLRYSFLKSIFVEGLSVKNAAIKWKMHYSSAKIIARMAKRANLFQLFPQDLANIIPTKQCGWQDLCPCDSSTSLSTPDKDSENSPSFSQTVSNVNSCSRTPIEIVSTIGWSYNNFGIVHSKI